MPQVVSKSLAKAGDTSRPSSTKASSSSSDNLIMKNSHQHPGLSSTWKNSLIIAFHGAAASTYGFAICWQNVSEASRLLYLRSNPLVRIYGRWRFLTYNCLILQFVAFSLCLTAHFVPKLRRPRDFVFTSLAFPIGIVVVTTFWGVWMSLGRAFIFPIELEPYYPPWLNHITHTIIAPINLIELLAFRKQYSSDKKAIATLTGYTVAYTSYLMYIKWQTGRFVYPFLNHFTPVGVGVFIVGLTAMVIGLYKCGKYMHDAAHGNGVVRRKLSNGAAKKKH
uniref:Androgen-induced gene 1 protein n=1 Tax=Aceria tosichella TaxID=561515 RepID=A0A6G1SP14_9ACAR